MVDDQKQTDRNLRILELCRDQNVLNLGCLAADKKSRLHQKICKVAKSCMGLDLDENPDLDNYIKGDAQAYNFDDHYDVVIAGEIVEHLWNLEGFFRSAHCSLAPGGRLIITTPNPYAPIFMKSAIFGRLVPNDPGHVAMYDMVTFGNLTKNFASKFFSSAKIYYYEERSDSQTSLQYKIQRGLARINRGFSRGIFIELTK